MKTAAVITYPGHFFQTRMCLDSLKFFYPDIKKFFLVYDEKTIEYWPDYVADMQQFYNCSNIDLPLEFVSFSQVDPLISSCPIGWYRQQLTKCCLDRVLPGESWFVVDGDVIFDERIDIKNVTPAQNRPMTDDSMTVMILNYIKTALGITQHPLVQGDRFFVTSSIPFRELKKSTLTKLREIVSENLSGDFVARHVEMVYNQQLIVYSDTPTALIMHEWELIEAVNQLIDPVNSPIVELSAGYDTMQHTSYKQPVRYRHGYYKDAELPIEWLRAQFVDFPEQYWQKSLNYYDALTNKIMNQTL
jgi:hypothetical protein